MHVRKLSLSATLLFASIMFHFACGTGDMELPVSIGIDESALAPCGRGLYCSLSNVSGSTYCQSGTQSVYCCPSGQKIVNGACRTCTTTCGWEARCRVTGGTWHDSWKVWVCKDTCTGAKTEHQTCCWTTSPGGC